MLAAVEAIHTNIHTGGFAHCAVFIEDVDGVEVVLFAEHVVVFIVGGSDFQTAGTEVDFYVAVFDYGHHAANQRHDYFLAFEPRVLRVFGVDAHCGVAHNGFGASGSHHSVAATLGIAMHYFLLSAGFAAEIVIGEVIAQIVEFRLLVDEVHLVIADGGAVFGVPVDHTQAAID